MLGYLAKDKHNGRRLGLRAKSLNDRPRLISGAILGQVSVGPDQWSRLALLLLRIFFSLKVVWATLCKLLNPPLSLLLMMEMAKKEEDDKDDKKWIPVIALAKEL